MAQSRVPRFAFASPSSPKVSFFDHSTWIPYGRKIPDDIGSLVESGGDLLFFVKLMDETSRVADAPTKKWVRVCTWNPFTKATEELPRPRSITSLPFLVRVQPFYQLELGRTLNFSEESGDIKYKYLPPMTGYIFSMVGLDHEGKKVMESFYWYPESTIWRIWRITPCDQWTIRDSGLYPPCNLFRQTDTGSLVKFDAPKTFIQSPHPDIKREHFAKLDDPYEYVFLLPDPESVSGNYYFQTERHASRDEHEVNHSSRGTELHDAGACGTYVYGAKSGAIVVQQLNSGVEDSPKVEMKIRLYVFESERWSTFVDSSKIFRERDFSKAFLCQTTAAYSLADSRSVDSDTSNSMSFSSVSSNPDMDLVKEVGSCIILDPTA